MLLGKQPPTVLKTVRPRMQNGLKQFRRFVPIAFSERYLLITNIGLCVSLSALGDTIQQSVKRARGLAKTHDYVRTKNMSVAAVSMGIICHYWYRWLDRFLPGYSMRIVMKKVIWDQIVLSPFMWVTYFVVLGLLEQSGYARFYERLTDKGGKLYLAEWLVWPPAQVLNFYFLPTRFRVLYDNIVSLGFDWYSSYLLNDHGVTNPEQNAVSSAKNVENDGLDEDVLVLTG